MKKIFNLFLFCFAVACFGEGVITNIVSSTRLNTKTTLQWITSTNGWANTNIYLSGDIKRVVYTSGVGQAVTNLPTNLYDITLTDEDGVDSLIGTGANIGSNAVIQFYAATNQLPLAVDGLHTFIVTNAGSLRSGTVSIYTR